MNTEEQKKIAKAFPLTKSVECIFCGSLVDLTRCGAIKSNGTPDFWYIETEWYEGGDNHKCEWILDRPEKIGPPPEDDPPPKYGPWKVSFWEPGKKKKKPEEKLVQGTLEEWF